MALKWLVGGQKEGRCGSRIHLYPATSIRGELVVVVVVRPGTSAQDGQHHGEQRHLPPTPSHFVKCGDTVYGMSEIPKTVPTSLAACEQNTAA